MSAETSGERLQKLQLKALDSPEGTAFGELLLSNILLFLYGQRNRDKPDGVGEFGHMLYKDAVFGLRSVGEYIALAYEATAQDIADMVNGVTESAEGLERGVATTDWICGRIAEGLYKQGKHELGREVFERYVIHDQVRPSVLEYFNCIDRDVMTSFPV